MKEVKKRVRFCANAGFPSSCLKKKDVSLSALSVEVSVPTRIVNASFKPEHDFTSKVVKILMSIWKPSAPPPTISSRFRPLKARHSRDNISIAGSLGGNAPFAVSANEVGSL